MEIRLFVLTGNRARTVGEANSHPLTENGTRKATGSKLEMEIRLFVLTGNRVCKVGKINDGTRIKMGNKFRTKIRERMKNI